MIGMLTGKFALHNNSSIIISVHGVGYKVFVPQDVIAKQVLGSEMTIYTHTHVREDMLELYGFLEQEDLRLFEYMIGVSGVGCKTALGIFSVGTREDVVKAIVTADISFFTTVPRLGKKNAQKLIIELKGKLGGVGDLDLSGEGSQDDEAIKALETIGFSIREAVVALKATQREGDTVEEKIKAAIKYLGK